MNLGQRRRNNATRAHKLGNNPHLYLASDTSALSCVRVPLR